MQKKTRFLKWGRMAAVLLGVMALALTLNVQSAKAANTPFATPLAICQLTWLGGGIPLDTSMAPADAQQSLKDVTLTSCTYQSLIESCNLVAGPGDALLNYDNIKDDDTQTLIQDLQDEGLSLSCLYKNEDGPFTNGWVGTIGAVEGARCDQNKPATNDLFSVLSGRTNRWYCFANAGSMHRFVEDVAGVCTGNNDGSLMLDMGGHYREIFFPRGTCSYPAGQSWDGTKGIYPTGKNMTRILINGLD